MFRHNPNINARNLFHRSSKYRYFSFIILKFSRWSFIRAFWCWRRVLDDTIFNFMGIPPVYVPNEVNNILATSVSGSLTHWYKKTLDYKMGLMIVLGGVVGTIIGIMTFTFFQK